MEIYKQTDSRWGWLGLGHSSPFKCKDFGSEIVAITQTLALSGWNLTPYNVIGKMVDANGFTDETFELGPGLVKYEVLVSQYPQIHLGGQGFSITRGVWGRYAHSILADAAGILYDPFYGTNQSPTGFITTGGYIRTFTVDPHI